MTVQQLQANAAAYKCEGIGCAFKGACGRYLRPEAVDQQWASFYAVAGDDCSDFETVNQSEVNHV